MSALSARSLLRGPLALGLGAAATVLLACEPPPDTGLDTHIVAKSGLPAEIRSASRMGRDPGATRGAEPWSQRIHREAHERALELATEIFADMQAFDVSRLRGQTLASPLTRAIRPERFRARFRALEKELSGIRVEVLAPEPALVRELIDFERARQAASRMGLDLVGESPNWAFDQIQALLAEVEARWVSGGCLQSEQCADSLELAARELPRLRPMEAAQSRAELEWATRRGRAMAIELEGMSQIWTRSDSPSAAELGSAGLALAQSIRGRVGELEADLDAWASSSETLEWSEIAPPFRSEGKGQRRPDVWGEQRLAALLSQRERVEPKVDVVIEAIARTLRRFTAIGAQSNGQAETAADLGLRSAQEAIELCRSTSSRLSGFATQHPEWTHENVDCTRFVAGRSALPTRSEVRRELVQVSLLRPSLATLRNAQWGPVALITGRWALPLQREMQQIMVGHALQWHDEVRLAASKLIRSSCLAIASLQIHRGEDPRTPDACGQFAAAAVRREALGHPWAALSGVTAAYLGETPAEFVGVQRFAWAPVGWTPRLADPDGTRLRGWAGPGERRRAATGHDNGTHGGPRVKVESLTPQRREPAADAP